MREGYHILFYMPTSHLSHGFGKALRGLLGCLTAQYKLSRTMKKGCHGAVKLLRAEPGSIATIMLMQAIYYLNERSCASSAQLGAQFRALWALSLRQEQPGHRRLAGQPAVHIGYGQTLTGAIDWPVASE
jgi:hypothetical protein